MVLHGWGIGSAFWIVSLGLGFGFRGGNIYTHMHARQGHQACRLMGVGGTVRVRVRVTITVTATVRPQKEMCSVETNPQLSLGWAALHSWGGL